MIYKAVQRLNSQFETLLAAKLWRLTRNEGSSRLLVAARLERVAQTTQTLLHRDTRLTNYLKCASNTSQGVSLVSQSTICPQGEPTTSTSDTGDRIPKISIGTEIQYRLENLGQDPIYYLLMGIDASGHGFTLSLPRRGVGASASAVKSELLNNSPDSYALDVNTWATLTFIYQVVG